MMTRFKFAMAVSFATTISCTSLPTTPRGVIDANAGGASGEVGSPHLDASEDFKGVDVGTMVDTGRDVSSESGVDHSMPDAPLGAGGSVDGAAATGKDAPLGSGGALGLDAPFGTGGISGSGGVPGLDAPVDSGGITGSGGTGGATGVCQDGATQCLGSGVQTCTSGQWGAVVACGPRQTCAGPVGAAKCTCKSDPVCTSVGSTCAGTSSLATCAQDEQTCIYEQSATTCADGACAGPAGAASCCANACAVGGTCLSSTSLQTCAIASNGCTAIVAVSTCSDGACSGPAGAASCCTNACTIGETQCASATSLQTCGLAANGCEAYTASACSNGLVCERYAPAACADPNWAEWAIPNGPADVAAGAPNPESYKDNGDGTVTDNVTGLMWQQAVPATTYAWADAVAYCPTLTLGGHSDWRLPSVIEIGSLFDYGQSPPPYINATVFPATPSTSFWSSTQASSTGNAWTATFDVGSAPSTAVFPITYSATSNLGAVRCVR